MGTHLGDVPHGHRTRYARGCRCDRCRRAAARYEQELQLDHLAGRSRRLDATGTRRRLQALHALGYPWARIGRHLGWTGERTRKRAVCDHPVIFRRTADQVAAVYADLCMTIPTPETPREVRWIAHAQATARAEGWPPPLAWDDDIDDPNAVPHTTDRDDLPRHHGYDPVVVDRILAGEYQLTSTVEEKAEVCARWHASGRTMGALARRTGWKTERYYTPTIPREDAAA